MSTDLQRSVLGLQLARYIDAHRQWIEAHGVSIETSTNAKAMAKLSARFKDKPTMSEPFRLDLNDLLPNEVFWIFGHTPKGKLAHIHALRLYDIGPICLAELWQRHLKRIVKHTVGKAHCPPAFQITGRIAYQGELCIRKSKRRSGLGAAVVRLGQALAYAHWRDLDYLYAFMSKQIVYSGFADRQGYCNHTPAAVDWTNGKPAFDQDDWLVWMSRPDLEWRFTQPPEAFF